jgi:hypothetical protein
MANGQATKTLGDINQVLSNALAQVGYGTTGYYSYPDGFALATRMEQIFPDGRPMSPPARFSDSPPMPRTFTLQYFEHLFVPQQGFFRIVVFIVTDQRPRPSHRSGRMLAPMLSLQRSPARGSQSR